MQRGLFFSLLWRSVVSKCISSDQLTAGSATSFSSLITVILFLPYQCYHPPCHSKTWWPAGILVHPGDKPFTFLLPNLSQIRSPHHILCQSHPSQHLIPDPHLPHFIFQQSLAMAIYTIPANQTLRVFQCLDILFFFFFAASFPVPAVLVSAFQHPSAHPGLVLHRSQGRSLACTFLHCLSPTWNIAALTLGKAARPPPARGPTPCFQKWFFQIIS